MAKGIKGSGPTEDIPTRTTLIMRPSIMKKMKVAAAMIGSTQTALIEEALTDYIAKYEKKNGAIPVK